MRYTRVVSLTLGALLAILPFTLPAGEFGGQLGIRLTLVDSCEVRSPSAIAAPVVVNCSARASHDTDDMSFDYRVRTRHDAPFSDAASTLVVYW